MDTAATLALLLNSVFDGAAGGPDHETASAILDEAARFAERHLTPLAAMSSTRGCRMAAGHVKTATAIVTTTSTPRSTRSSRVRISP